MKVTREKTENSQAFLTIEMEPAEMDKELEKAYGRLVKKANIPGFRKGKAPRSILEQYVSKEGLLEEAVNHMVPEVCDKAIKEQDIKLVARPEVEVTKMEPVTFKVVVPLEPTVNTGDYHQIRVAPEPVEFKEEEVDKAIEQLRHNHATWEPVERPIEYNDMAVMEIESSIGAQPYINQKDAEYQVTKDLPYPMTGFAEQLIGLKIGDVKEFKLQFPAEYGRAELAGKEASFKVKIKEIKQEKLPEVNDDFAKKVGAEFNDVAALKERITTNLKRSAEERANMAFEEKVINAALDIAQIEFPPALVEHEIEHMIDDQMRRWQMSEKGLDEYLKNIKKTEQQLRDELRPMAERRVKQSLVLQKVFEQEKIEVSDSEVKDEIERMTKDMTEKKDQMSQFLNSPQAQSSVRNVIATRKTIERLVEIAKTQSDSAPAAQQEVKK